MKARAWHDGFDPRCPGRPASRAWNPPNYATVGEVSLCYELLGSAPDPVVVLVSGLGRSLIGWDDRFCTMVVDAGFRVLRFDNRDVGLSTHITGGPAFDIKAVRAGRGKVAYTLHDMAGDVAGLLTCLDIDSAHVVGTSMGGMIVQALAIAHPDRVRSLCSIMSTTGAGDVGTPTREAWQILMTRPPTDRDTYVRTELSNSRGHRVAGRARRRGLEGRALRTFLRPGHRPRGHRAPDHGHRGRRRPHRRPGGGDGAHPGRPRRRRHPRLPVGRRGHGAAPSPAPSSWSSRGWATRSRPAPSPRWCRPSSPTPARAERSGRARRPRPPRGRRREGPARGHQDRGVGRHRARPLRLHAPGRRRRRHPPRRPGRGGAVATGAGPALGPAQPQPELGGHQPEARRRRGPGARPRGRGRRAHRRLASGGGRTARGRPRALHWRATPASSTAA